MVLASYVEPFFSQWHILIIILYGSYIIPNLVVKYYHLYLKYYTHTQYITITLHPRQLLTDY